MNIDITTISDRTSWLAYRADWRRRYKEASEAIRSLKREIAGHRAKRRELGDAGKSHEYAADNLQSGLLRLRLNANWLMQELTDAKEHKAAIMAAKASEAPVAA
jgi:chromosome segregation ATPase